VLAIASAVLFEDYRCHLTYTDGSAIILHPGGGDCFTYFSPDGKKTRMLSRYAVKKGATDKVLEKLTLAIDFVNTFGDMPCFNREETFAERVQLPYKLT